MLFKPQVVQAKVCACCFFSSSVVQISGHGVLQQPLGRIHLAAMTAGHGVHPSLIAHKTSGSFIEESTPTTSPRGEKMWREKAHASGLIRFLCSHREALPVAGAVEESTSKRAAVANRIFLLPRVKPILKGQMSEKGPLGSQTRGFQQSILLYYGKVVKNLRETFEREAWWSMGRSCIVLWPGCLCEQKPRQPSIQNITCR